jgi:RsmE family RNA methyltransferase
VNRILFDKTEIQNSTVRVSGERALHIIGVLHSEVGDILKTGEIDGPIGFGKIVEISAEREVVINLSHSEKSPEPWIDVILAPPRPRVFKRLLPQLVQLGVGNIYLVGAKKVEKDFWGATILKRENYTPVMIDALMQAGTSTMPSIFTRRNLKAFLRDEVDLLFPRADRIFAHPDKKEGLVSGCPPRGRTLLAIGPEGGWTDDEAELFKSKGFRSYSLGARILKTDTAAVALIARLMGD